jgi:hypothetical protein
VAVLLDWESVKEGEGQNSVWKMRGRLELTGLLVKIVKGCIRVDFRFLDGVCIVRVMFEGLLH